MVLLRTEGVSKVFGGLEALSDFSMTVNNGELIGLIGPNGSGKSTLINVISGSLKQTRGRVFYQDRDISRMPMYKRTRAGVVRTFQIPRPLGNMTVAENVGIPLITSGEGRGKSLKESIIPLLETVGLTGKYDAYPSDLTQIEMRKMELARALASKPNVLLLDEVMAGLTPNEINEALEILRNLNKQGVTMVVVEHIMRAVMSLCKRIVVLNMGKQIAEGTPDEIFKNKLVIDTYLGT